MPEPRSLPKLEVDSPAIWARQFDRQPTHCPDEFPNGSSLGLVCIVLSEDDQGRPRETTGFAVPTEAAMLTLADTQDQHAKLWFVVPKTQILAVCPTLEREDFE